MHAYLCTHLRQLLRPLQTCRETEEADERYVSRWVQPLGAVEVLEPDYESSSGAPGKTLQPLCGYIHYSSPVRHIV